MNAWVNFWWLRVPNLRDFRCVADVLLLWVLLALGTAHADKPTLRQVVAQDSPFTKNIGEVANETPEGTFVGDAWFIGSDGCNIVTNFHVALGRGVSKDDRTLIVKPPFLGRTAEFHYAVNQKTGAFTRKTIAVVTDFGNYEQGTMSGLRSDLAVMRLKECAGKDYLGLEVDQSEENQENPPGKLMTLSHLRTDDGRRRVAVQTDCSATIRNPSPGIVAHSCEVVGGMSGSPVLVQGSDSRWRVVAMNVKEKAFPDGTPVGIGISANYLIKFLREAKLELPR